MARPQVHPVDRVTTAIRIPKELHERLQQAAADRRVGLNLLVNWALEEYLDELVPLDQLRSSLKV